MFPIRFTLQVRRRVEDGVDAHNNPVVTYDEPADWPVYGYAPRQWPPTPASGTAMAEFGAMGRNLDIVAWTVFAPKSDATPGALDHVVLDGVEYEVVGEPMDWTNGPWQVGAGVVVELRYPEG